MRMRNASGQSTQGKEAQVHASDRAMGPGRCQQAGMDNRKPLCDGGRSMDQHRALLLATVQRYQAEQQHTVRKPVGVDAGVTIGP